MPPDVTRFPAPPYIVCIAVDGNGDPDISGTPLVLRSKHAVDWFPVSPPATVPDINGVQHPYAGPVFDPAFAWYVYEVPTKPDPQDGHTPIFKVCATRAYTSGTLTGKLAIVWADFWPGQVPTAASALLGQFVAAGKLAMLSPAVLTANEAMIQIA